MPAVNDYVLEVQSIFRAKGMHIDVDISGNTMQKKIRTGQLAQYNFIFGKLTPCILPIQIQLQLQIDLRRDVC